MTFRESAGMGLCAMLDAGQEELLGLAVRIKELRQKVARLPVVRELAALEAEFERRSGGRQAPGKPEVPSKKPVPKMRRPTAEPLSFRAKVEATFRDAHKPLTWVQAGKMLGVRPKTLRSTMSTLLDKKRIERVSRGLYVWKGAESGNGLLPTDSREARG